MTNKMIKNFSVLALLILLLPLGHADFSIEQEIRGGCNKVKAYGLLGKKYYDQKQYKKALDQFQDQASWTSFCLLNQEDSRMKLSEQDVVIANNNVGLTYAKLGKPLWARAWFLLNPEATSSQFNLSKLPTPKASHSLSGQYIRSNRFGFWDTITVTKNQSYYEISYEGLYFPYRGLISGPNMGEFITYMALDQKKTTYKTEDCKIDLAFNFDKKYGQQILVKQSGISPDCGFGYNVSSEGTYLKVEK